MTLVIVYLLGMANHYFIWTLPDKKPGQPLGYFAYLGLVFWPLWTIVTLASAGWLQIKGEKIGSSENETGVN